MNPACDSDSCDSYQLFGLLCRRAKHSYSIQVGANFHTEIKVANSVDFPLLATATRCHKNHNRSRF